MKHFTEITDLGTFDIFQMYDNVEQMNLDQVSKKIRHIRMYFYAFENMSVAFA